MASEVLQQIVSGHAAAVAPLRVDQVEQMLEAGILNDGDPLELIDGVLVRKDRGGDGMTYGRRHALVVSLLTDCKPHVEALGCYLRVQQPIVLTATSAPEPDVCIVEGNARSYAERNPGPLDVLVVIEVADSSLAFDRGPKLRLYASAGIRCYVIVDISNARIEVHEDPDPARGCYERRSEAGEADTVRLALGNHGLWELAARDILPLT